MAGTVREAKLQNPTQCKRLKSGRQPHWNTIVAGRDHLGWQRRPEDAAGRWIYRRRRSGDYSTESIGIADDRDEADGVSILDFQQARAKAVELSLDEARPAGRITVSRAIADYIDYLSASGKLTSTAESAAVTWILPKLGHCEVAALTSQQLRSWVAWMAENGGDEEQIRRRRSSANRHLSVLKAALNHAFDEGRISSNAAWGRRVKKYRGVASTRARYLTIPEARRFLNACDPVFKPLARAALETGCRYSELARLEVCDFNKVSGTLHVRKSKSAKARHVVLTAEGTTFFSDATAGRSPAELLFTRENGERWGHGNQGWYVKAANEKGNIDPPIHFHLLRHTWASLAVMNAVPLMVVARNLGHVDTRMVERVYGHLAPSFIADAIRQGAPRFV
jgi:integrase